MLCLNCYHCWPSGTRFCGSCRRSLNARYCPNDHNNPLEAAQTCLTCNHGPLTEGASALSTDWIIRGVSILVVVMLVIGGFTQLNWVFHATCSSILRLSGPGIGTVLCMFYWGAIRLASWYIALWIGSHLLVEPYGPAFRRGLAGSFEFLGTLPCKVVQMLWKMLVLLAVDSKSKDR